jgi:hypothetical protein
MSVVIDLPTLLYIKFSAVDFLMPLGAPYVKSIKESGRSIHDINDVRMMIIAPAENCQAPGRMHQC